MQQLHIEPATASHVETYCYLCEVCKKKSPAVGKQYGDLPLGPSRHRMGSTHDALISLADDAGWWWENSQMVCPDCPIPHVEAKGVVGPSGAMDFCGCSKCA